MIFATYPPELPPPPRASYQKSVGDGRLVSRNDAGPRNRRRRFSSTVKTVTFSILLDRAQLARFWRFYYEETKEGSLAFLLPNPVTDGWPLLDDEGAPLLDETGTPLLNTETWLVTFGDRLPSVTVKGATFTVSFELEVLPT